MGWGKDNPPGGPVETNRDGGRYQGEVVEPWHGKATATVDPLPSIATCVSPADTGLNARYHLCAAALQHFPTETLILARVLGSAELTRVDCACGMNWTTEPHESPQAARGAWAQHYAGAVIA